MTDDHYSNRPHAPTLTVELLHRPIPNPKPQIQNRNGPKSITLPEQIIVDAVLNIGGEINKMREPLIAGVLSFLLPGLGQIYNGRVLIGILWLILTGFSWIGSAGTLGWVVHLIAAWCAYSFAKDNPVR